MNCEGQFAKIRYLFAENATNRKMKEGMCPKHESNQNNLIGPVEELHI